MKKAIYAAALLGMSFVATQATASTYSYSSPVLNGVQANYEFNSVTEVFSLDFNVLAADNIDGFWFVVNDGPQPYFSNSGEFAIMYSDLNNIWAYQYETSVAGVGGVNTAFNGTQLEEFSSAVTATANAVAGTINYAMTLDVSTLNNLTGVDPDWVGVAFGLQLGTWLHPTRNTFDSCTGPYVDNGDLNCFRGNNWNGWDESFVTTNVSAVPLPATGLLLLAGIGGLAFGSRRRKA